MTESNPSLLLRLLAGLAAWFGVAIAGPCALAQSASSASLCREELWIASSWRCRQAGCHECPSGDLDFFYRAPCAQPIAVNREAFYASLIPGAPVCVVAHGSFAKWDGIYNDCAPVARWLRSAAPNRPLNLIFFSWPSDGPITLQPNLDIGILGMRATYNCVYLGDLVARIPPGHPITIIGHSHGARIAAAALHLLGGGDVNGTRLTYLPPSDQRIRAILVAAAIDHQWLDPGERYSMALCRSECIVNLRSDRDWVLAFYPLRRPFSHRALGDKGLNDTDRMRLGPLGGRFLDIDVTGSVGSGHEWDHYYRRPELATTIAPYVFYFSDGPAAEPQQGLPSQTIAPASASLHP
jgi:hypothetical protein